MLVLNRKLNEEIVIQVPGYEDIVVTPTRIRLANVRIGITAPQTVQVWRREVLNQRESAAATTGGSGSASDGSGDLYYAGSDAGSAKWTTLKREAMTFPSREHAELLAVPDTEPVHVQLDPHNPFTTWWLLRAAPAAGIATADDPRAEAA